MEVDMATTRVTVFDEVRLPKGDAGWVLCFQWGRYDYGEGEFQRGYRFIWRRPDGSLQPARGQARIPTIEDIETLIGMARAAGWGDHDGDAEGHGATA
jgi:hypothetical protein